MRKIKYTKEELSRIDEAQKLLDAAIAKRVKENAEKKTRWEKYYNQLAKMPEYNPGARKSPMSIKRSNNI